MFKTTLTEQDLGNYLNKQLSLFFPDGDEFFRDYKVKKSLKRALERTEYCFQHVSLKQYSDNGTTFFSHLHSDQYTVFLWFLSNSLWIELEDDKLASKLFYLNKALNGVACMYDANLPDIFLILHGGGIVLGKASYADFFVCCQGCTVGAVRGHYPILGRGIAMAPNSTIVGECNIGDYSTIGNQVLWRSKDLETNSLVFRDMDTSITTISKKDTPWAQSFFNVKISH